MVSRVPTIRGKGLFFSRSGKRHVILKLVRENILWWRGIGRTTLIKLYTHVCDHNHNILIKFDSHGNRFSHLGVTALYLQKTTWNRSCLGQTSTLLGAIASNIHRCLSYMCRLSRIIIMALTFCGKKTEVEASVSYGHISSFIVFKQMEFISHC